LCSRGYCCISRLHLEPSQLVSDDNYEVNLVHRHLYFDYSLSSICPSFCCTILKAPKATGCEFDSVRIWAADGGCVSGEVAVLGNINLGADTFLERSDGDVCTEEPQAVRCCSDAVRCAVGLDASCSHPRMRDHTLRVDWLNLIGYIHVRTNRTPLWGVIYLIISSLL